MEKVVETTVTKTTAAAATAASAATAANAVTTDVVTDDVESRHHASPVFVPYPVHYRTVPVPVAVPVDDFAARFVSGNAGVNLGPLG